LLPVPVALVEHQVADARHVARGNDDRIGRILRDGEVPRLGLDAPVPVLEFQRDGELGLELVVDVPLREVLEGGAGGVEIPVAVEHVAAGLL
jgi:hypothetical protein